MKRRFVDRLFQHPQAFTLTENWLTTGQLLKPRCYANYAPGDVWGTLICLANKACGKSLVSSVMSEKIQTALFAEFHLCVLKIRTKLGLRRQSPPAFSKAF